MRWHDKDAPDPDLDLDPSVPPKSGSGSAGKEVVAAWGRWLLPAEDVRLASDKPFRAGSVLRGSALADDMPRCGCAGWGCLNSCLHRQWCAYGSLTSLHSSAWTKITGAKPTCARWRGPLSFIPFCNNLASV